MTRTNIPHPEERSAKARLEGRTAAPQEVPPPGRRIEITIAPADRGVRLDRALQRQLPELSRTRLKQLIVSGPIASDGELLRHPAQRASTGARIVVMLPEPAQPTLSAQQIPPAIRYADNH